MPAYLVTYLRHALLTRQSERRTCLPIHPIHHHHAPPVPPASCQPSSPLPSSHSPSHPLHPQPSPRASQPPSHTAKTCLSPITHLPWNKHTPQLSARPYGSVRVQLYNTCTSPSPAPPETPKTSMLGKRGAPGCWCRGGVLGVVFSCVAWCLPWMWVWGWGRRTGG